MAEEGGWRQALTAFWVVSFFCNNSASYRARMLIDWIEFGKLHLSPEEYQKLESRLASLRDTEEAARRAKERLCEAVSGSTPLPEFTEKVAGEYLETLESLCMANPDCPMEFVLRAHRLLCFAKASAPRSSAAATTAVP